jgi:hypothetical protein
MNIAHLILAHTNGEQVKRLIRRLANFSDVYIHVDAKADISEFIVKDKMPHDVVYIEPRLHCWWGGASAISAEMSMLRSSIKKHYDRYVFLSGLDYPIKPDNEIIRFFEAHKDVEFIRACCISDSNDYRFYRRCKQIWFFDHINMAKRIWHRFNMISKIPFRSGLIHDGENTNKAYWGSAYWAFTNPCAEYVMDFYDSHQKFNKWFKHSCTVDELYFHTIVHNSEFSKRTLMGGPEPEHRGLVYWRNLHYFDYGNEIRVFDENDFEMLSKLDELYVRKVSGEPLSRLLDAMNDRVLKVT